MRRKDIYLRLFLYSVAYRRDLELYLNYFPVVVGLIIVMILKCVLMGQFYFLCSFD